MAWRVLVTGGAGYLGAAVVARLSQEGAAVVACDRVAGEGITTCDLADRAAVGDLVGRHRPDVVIHAAALVPRNADDYEDEAQAETSLDLVGSLVAARPQRIVFVSSMTVYGNCCGGIVDESAVAPDSAYARGKIAAEEMLAGSGLQYIAVRMPGLFGPPRQNGLVANLVREATRGKAPVLPGTPLVWAGIHVADAADGIVRLARAPHAEGPINFGYPGPISINRLIAMVEAISGHAIPCAVRHPDFEMRLDKLARCGAVPHADLASRLHEMADAARRAAQPEPGASNAG